MKQSHPICAVSGNNQNGVKMYENLVVAIGASAGGFEEIVKIVETLPSTFAGTIIIATHREPGRKNMLANILSNKAQVRVDEPQDEECLECTTIYVGSPNEKVEVDGQEFGVVDDRSKYARMRRIDDLFMSVAKSAGKNAVGIILSGMLNDGTAGLKAIHDAGGRCVIQSPRDAKFAEMPISALEKVEPNFLGTTEEICSYLMQLAIDREC